jgi:hypothetical protein
MKTVASRHPRKKVKLVSSWKMTPEVARGLEKVKEANFARTRWINCALQTVLTNEKFLP